MAGAEVLVFLLVAVALLAGIALRHDVPYPIVLVLGGLALGFVPWLPAPELEPDMRRERAFPAELLRELEAEIDVDEARVRSRGR